MPHHSFGSENLSSLQQIDLKGSDLELGTISRLQRSPDTSGVSLFVRPKVIRISDPALWVLILKKLMKINLSL